VTIKKKQPQYLKLLIMLMQFQTLLNQAV